MLALRDYQQNTIDAVEASYASGAKGVFIVSPTGSGKCLGKGTPVLLYDGTVRPVEEIKAGDLLMGPDSTHRRVLSVCSGTEKLYKIIPVKGDPYIVNESHILSLKISPSNSFTVGGNGVRYRSGDIANISLRQYLSSSQTFKHRAKGWRTGVDFAEGAESFFIPPYILGVWLGDGRSRLPAIDNVDHEVIDEWRSWAETVGLQCVKKQSNNRIASYAILSPATSLSTAGRSYGRGYKSNPVINELRRLNLILNKHIPLQYKTASKADRLQLLAGIIDTDGYLTHGGYTLSLKQKQLAEDVVFVARSLGFAAYFKECQKTCTNTGKTGTYYNISISGDLSVLPCRVPRRKAGKRKQIKDVLVTGIRVEPVGIGEYYGFEIDGDRLFLLGDFTVTHNTVVFTELIRRWTEQGKRCVVVAHRQELIKQAGKTIERNGMWHGVIKAGPSTAPMAPVQVVSIDSMRNRELPWNPDYIVVDEAHLCKADRYKNFFEKYPEARLLLVSATPIRTDGSGFDDLAQELVVSATIDELINHPEGPFLVHPKIYAASDISDLDKQVKTTAGDYNKGQLEEFMNQVELVGDVIENYWKIAQGRKGVVFCAGVHHSQTVAAQFCAAGIPAEHLDGTTPDREREAILGRLQDGQTRIVTNAAVLTEGWDCLDSETEILTKDGWRGIHQVKQGDFIYSLNKITGSLELVTANSVGSRPVRPEEKMVTFKSQHLNIRVTEGHQFHIKYRVSGRLSNNFIVKTARELSTRKSGYALPLSAEASFSGLPLTDDEIRFIAWFMTDGGFVGSSICISQSKDYHYDIRSLLNRLGLDYRERIRANTGYKPGTSIYEFKIPKGTHSGNMKRNGWFEKFGPYLDKNVSPELHKMTKEQFFVFWTELLKGDGDVQKNKSGWLWCDRIEKANAYTQMAVTRGFASSYKARKTKHGRTVYAVTVRDKQWITSYPSDKRATKISIEDSLPDEIVWCVQNVNSTLVTRRAGKVAIIGNCPSISYVGLARPTKSLALYIQMAGRGLRIHPGKSNCVINDHSGNVERHGHILVPRFWSLKGRGKKQDDNSFRECPSCHFWHEKSLTACPSCGYTKPEPMPATKKEIRLIDARLKEVSVDEQVVDEVQLEYRRLLKYARQKNIKPGWAYFKCRDKFGIERVKQSLRWSITRAFETEYYWNQEA